MYTHPKYPILFSPLKVNKLMLKNRIFYAPVEYYHDRALAGAAVMMRGTSGTLKDPKCRISPGKWLFSDSELPRVKKELSLIKRAGSIASLEVMHAGLCACGQEGYVIGPSDGISPKGIKIVGMTKEMMKDMIEDFANTCRIAKQIGYDMVMVHFAHGWIASQFFSTSYNQRTDEFGGVYENRVRFPKMILRAIRQAVGKDYPIDMRISAYEAFDGCMPQDEVIRFIKEVAQEGLIDMVNVSYGGELSYGADSNNIAYPTQYDPDMCYADYAAAIKKEVAIPVAVVGKIMTPEQAELILTENKADAVVIGRSSIADPYWAKKAFECRSEDIVPCISCGKCFDKRCSVNLRGYQENYIPLQLKKEEEKKKVVIVGGGPAGMKAALTADQRGYDVVLYEATDCLGGLLKTTDYDENKRELRRYKDYLICQINKSNVQVKYNTLATRNLIENEKPDQLILAMGSSPATLRIKGIEHAIQCIDAHEQMESIGKNVVIIGGGLVGSEFALTLAYRNHHVTLIERTGVYGGKNDNTTFKPYDLIKNNPNIDVFINASCTNITDSTVEFENEKKETYRIEADTVILSVGFKSNNENIEQFYGITPHTTIIGDLRRPSSIRECEEEGYFAVSGI